MFAHYGLGAERARLSAGAGRVERARTEEVLARWLPRPPARILDVGGGPGTYVAWLAAQGYEVHLVDPVPLHVEQAREAGAATARVGDARRLDEPDEASTPSCSSARSTTSPTGRAASARWPRPGGSSARAAWSRPPPSRASRRSSTASSRGALDDPAFASIVERDLVDGQHRNPTPRPEWFTTAFFHRPDELKAEVADAGLRLEELVGLEGPAWLLPRPGSAGPIAERRERLLSAARAIEREPALLGLSAHLLAVARR